VPRVLMADDQIPNEDIPDSRVITEYRRQYPGKSNKGLAAAFVVMRRLVHTMREGFSVDIANHHADVLNLVQTRQYDVAIVDLGWWVDRESLGTSCMTAGWSMRKLGLTARRRAGIWFAAGRATGLQGEDP
jgi:hypothetical protein